MILITNVVHESPSIRDPIMLRQRAMKASGWVVIGIVGCQLARLGSNLFLTRFLAPDAFGLMAIAFGLIAGINMFSDIGIQTNIVQSKRGDTLNFLRTAWTIQIIRGGVISAGVLVTAGILFFLQLHEIPPPLSAYADPTLVSVMASLAIIPLINGFLSVNYHVAERNIDQKRRVILELISTITPIPLMAFLVIVYPSIWVLVAGTLFGEILKISVSHALFGGSQNRLLFDKESASELFHFGKWIMLSSLLGFLALQGDKLILGGLLTSEQLGWYAIAGLFIAAAEQTIRRFQASIAFPLMATKAREGGTSFIEAYYRFRFYIDPLVIMGSCLLIVLGDDLIALLYTEAYKEAGWILQILGVRILLLIYGMQGQAFVAQGEPKYLSKIITIRVAVMLSLLPIVHYYFGFRYAVLTIALAPIPGVVYCFYIFHKKGWLSARRELLIIPLVAAALLITMAIELLWTNG